VLTHTLEVSQIARTVAAALGLNTSLWKPWRWCTTSAIAVRPRRRTSARWLIAPVRRIVNHNLHALRIVEKFEQR